MPVRRDDARLAFAAPGFARLGPVEEDDLARALSALHLTPDDVSASAWIDNGPGWMGLVLRDAAAVLALQPDFAAFGDLDVGAIRAHPPGGPADAQVRAFVPGVGINEDPVSALSTPPSGSG